MTARRRRAMTVALLLLLHAPAARLCAAPAATAPGAADGGAIRPRSQESIESRKLKDTSGRDGWLRTLGALAIVVALIFAVRFLLKRWGRLVPPAHRGEAIEMLAQVRLTSRQRLSLVRLGRRLVLVGSGPSGMSPLAEISDPAEAGELLAALRAGSPGTFGGVLARYRKTVADEGDAAELSKDSQADET